MSLFVMSVTVAKKLEAMRARFSRADQRILERLCGLNGEMLLLLWMMHGGLNIGSMWRRPIIGGVTFGHFMEMVGIIGEVNSTYKRDVWVWEIDHDGVFSIAATRAWINDAKRLPLRVSLNERGIDIPSLLCLVCGVDDETIIHIFSRCDVARSLWYLILRWLYMGNVEVSDPDSMYEWVDAVKVNAMKKKVLETIVCTTYWFLWRLRNDIVHEARKPALQLLMQKDRNGDRPHDIEPATPKSIIKMSSMCSQNPTGIDIVIAV
ncbi:hypothetical protein LXL04_030507 [Taraxacum kok-saghyz]